MSIGQRLKQARKRAELSGEKVGEMIGVSKSQISNIEKGTSDLTRSNAIVLSGRLGVSLNWLLTGEGDMMGNATNSGIIGSRNWQLHGNSNQVGTDVKALQDEIESLKREIDRQEKYIKRLEKLLDKAE